MTTIPSIPSSLLLFSIHAWTVAFGTIAVSGTTAARSKHREGLSRSTEGWHRPGRRVQAAAAAAAAWLEWWQICIRVSSGGCWAIGDGVVYVTKTQKRATQKEETGKPHSTAQQQGSCTERIKGLGKASTLHRNTRKHNHN